MEVKLRAGGIEYHKRRLGGSFIFEDNFAEQTHHVTNAGCIVSN